MTAISHVYNYTVRCPHIKDPAHPTTWQNHIEFNESCEIGLKRITKWHDRSGHRVFEQDGFTVREADAESAYFSMQTARLKGDGHVLVTINIQMDDATKDSSVQEIMTHLIQDFQQRLAKLNA
ncbi:cytoplasmic protein [Shewanella sp. AS1]|uniref:cytoplasmic protein n=1 Tax=Shewanella sp. AS1 TaxID=2907626 RepID=UPI001F37A6A6|nr:cytoplasmic protein [Shewanella sp. AS1]MCE9678058.1 cytoplasmic protein [Shewanella sp. AS1]